MRPSPLALALCLLGAAVAGCAGPRPALSTAADLVAQRPPDGLLVRPDLQALVDLQVRRDADGLVQALGSRDSVARARAAFALGSVQAASAVSALIGATNDPIPAVRADAAFAIGQSADSTAGVALLVALRTEATPSVLAELVDAIGKVGGRADADALADLTLPASVEPWQAGALARLLMRGVATPRALDWLVGRLRSPDADLRERAAYAFNRAAAPLWADRADAVRAAFDAAEGDPARMHLARALGRLDRPEDTARLAAALQGDPDARTRTNAASALAGRDDEPARNALSRALDDPDPHVAQTAGAALARIARPSPALVDRAQALLDGRRPWQVQAAVVPILVRAERTAAVAAWADRQRDPFARRVALLALGVARDEASLGRLFAAAADPDATLAAAALDALTLRWAASRPDDAPRFYSAFAAGLERNDLATVTTAAPVLADSAFWALGSGALLRRVYGTLRAPEDLEPMEAIVRAAGRVRDGSEVDFLVNVALTGPPGLRAAAKDGLNDRFVEGIEVEVTPAGPPETTSIDWTHLARLGRFPRLVLDTDRGRVVIEMDAEQAPQTVQMLTTTASRDLYDGVPFHRVVSNFVVQGGDYFRRDGYGGPRVPIRSEFTRLRYRTGTAGMASSGKDTEGVQFFVTHSPQPHLDGRYTAFGRVVEGQAVVDRILQGDRIRHARVIPDGRR